MDGQVFNIERRNESFQNFDLPKDENSAKFCYCLLTPWRILVGSLYKKQNVEINVVVRIINILLYKFALKYRDSRDFYRFA